MSDNWSRHLSAASGYLELGMIEEASEEVEKISPEEKMRIEVLAFRLDLFREARIWDGMEVVARHLSKLQPQDLRWILDLAWATRRLVGITEASAILKEVEKKFSQCALLHYNLGCYCPASNGMT